MATLYAVSIYLPLITELLLPNFCLCCSWPAVYWPFAWWLCLPVLHSSRMVALFSPPPSPGVPHLGNLKPCLFLFHQLLLLASLVRINWGQVLRSYAQAVWGTQLPLESKQLQCLLFSSSFTSKSF